MFIRHLSIEITISSIVFQKNSFKPTGPNSSPLCPQHVNFQMCGIRDDQTRENWQSCQTMN